MKNLLRKAIMLGMTMVLITGLLTGCNKVSTGGQASEEKLRIGCQVDSVDHGLGGNIKACANDNNIFYVDKFSIYKNDKEFSNITASQEIVPNLETCPDFICCTNDKLVYAMSGYALHVLDLNTNTEKKYFSNKHFEYVFARGDEVFVNLCDSEEVYEIIGDNEPVLFTGELSEYGFAQTADDKINFKINGKIFETDGKSYSYDGQTDSSWKEVLQVGEEPGVNKSTITTDEKGAYILCQYKNKYRGRHINPSYGNLEKTALFYYDAGNNKTNLLYKSKNGEQIGGYSVDKKKIYLLKNSGIYSIDFDGKNETKIFEMQVDMKNYADKNNYADNKVKRETEIIFEQCAEKLFVYYEEYTVEHLLIVL